MCVCVFVSVCVRERKGNREGKIEIDSEREGKRERKIEKDSENQGEGKRV